MRILIIILSLVFIASCSNDDTFEPKEMEFIEIGKGFTGLNNDTAQNIVVNNQEQWNVLLNSLSNTAIESLNQTEINFDKHTILGIISKNKPHTGFHINIKTIIETENNITVNYNLEDSGSGYTVTIQPFHIVKISKTNKTIEFNINK